MHLVYLDQNAASYLACAQEGSVWFEIRELLISGVAEGRAVCPMPYETVGESSPLHGDKEFKRIQIGELFSLVAKETATRKIRHILSDELLATVRPGHRVTPFFPFPKKWADDQVYIENVKMAHEKMLETLSNANLKMPVFKETQLSLKDVMANTLKNESLAFVEDFGRFLRGERSIFKQNEVMHDLINAGLRDEEAEVLARAAIKGDFFLIGVFYWDIVLCSYLERDWRLGHRDFERNDFLDMDRLIVACAYFDTIITDKYWAHACKHVARHDPNKAAIFKIGEAQEIKQHLARVLLS